MQFLNWLMNFMEVFLQAFKKSFEDAPDQYKYLMAPSLVPLYKDMYHRLDCQPETCDNKQERLNAIQYAIDFMAPYTRTPEDEDPTEPPVNPAPPIEV